MFLEKGVLKICSKFTGEHPCGSVISIKLQSKITLRHGCSPVNLLAVSVCLPSTFFLAVFYLSLVTFFAYYLLSLSASVPFVVFYLSFLAFFYFLPLFLCFFFSFFVNKVAALRLRRYQKETPTQVFLVIFAKFLRIAFFTEYIRWPVDHVMKILRQISDRLNAFLEDHI